MKRVAVVLSGCGFLDGSEIHEAVITLLALDSHDVSYQCFAPDIEQMHVINHLHGTISKDESRNVLVEAARICRGQIKDIKEASAAEFDALILPGGFGAAKNLSNFATSGAAMQVNPDVEILAKAFAAAGKPAGFICIAPALIATIYGRGVSCTIGQDTETANVLEKMGCSHVAAKVDEVVIDQKHKVVTTPAYMLATRISEAAAGIEKLVSTVLSLA
ncbi:MAG: isoprenoid biosynthesis glyoxalase ElbB [Hahellaceae bacterium]|nr:isoprenoid biosynthesis glyoxalase ElbB [Hahellaceae bacterium]